MSPGHPKEDPVAKLGIEDDELMAHDDESLFPSSFVFPRSGCWYTKVKGGILKHSVVVCWVLNVLFLVSLVLVSANQSIVRCKTSPDDQGGRYSPAEDAVEYVPIVFKLGSGHGVFLHQGFPTDETDRLKEELYSVKAPVVGLENDLFHQLHCLNRIRMALYPRRYNTSLTNPDGTVKYPQWLERKKITEPELEAVPMYRNVDKIQDWASQRSICFSSKRLHVENGAIVDYTKWGPDPEAAVADDIPAG